MVRTTHGGSRRGRLALSLTAALALGACATGAGDGAGGSPDSKPLSQGPGAANSSMPTRAQMQAQEASGMDPAPLPVYRVGDTFTFDQPDEVWTITGFDDHGRLVWRSSLGAERVSSIDPILPSLRHVAPDGRSVTRIINRSNELFPLRIGAQASFTEAAGMDEPPYSQTFDWSCAVPDAKMVSVPAGSFRTYQVDCNRSDGLSVTSFYAPAVGYVVRREITMNGQRTDTRQLAAYDTGSGMSSGPENAPLSEPPVAGERPAAPALAQGQPAAQAQPDMSPTAHTDVREAPAATMPPPMARRPAAPATTATPARPAAPPSTAAATTTGSQTYVPAGSLMIQLAAFRAEENARTGWTKLEAQYPQLLSGLRPAIQQVEIPGKGTFWRLFAGPVDQARADAICHGMAELQNHCKVVAAP